jgi:hypothetical protein
MIDPQHDEAVVLSYQRALGTLLRLISGFATAGALVYLLGWLRTFGYYGAFKAEWILPNLPFGQFASRGIFPILALVFGLYLSFSGIANYRIGIKLTKDLLFQSVLWFIVLVAIFVLPKFGYHTQTTGFTGAAVYLSALFAMTKFGEVVLELSNSGFKWRSNQITRLFWPLFFFGAMTFLFGSKEGERDKREAISDLPSIKIIKSEHMGTIVPDIKTLQEKTQQQEHHSDKELQINVQSTPEGLGRFVYLSPLANLSCCYSWTEGSLLCPYSFSQAR